MDAIINLDFDFFIKPTYFGSYFGERDWNSFEDFKAVSNRWLTPQDFTNKLGLNNPIRGCVVQENTQVIFNIKKIFSENYINSREVKIFLFDAHPNTYYWDEVGSVDSWSLGEFKSYNSTIAFFKDKIVDTITWVTPDYMDGQLMNKHFENFKIFKDKNIIIPVVSQSFTVRIKVIKWSEFINKSSKYNWKYFSFTTNPRMCLHEQEELHHLSNLIQQY